MSYINELLLAILALQNGIDVSNITIPKPPFKQYQDKLLYSIYLSFLSNTGKKTKGGYISVESLTKRNAIPNDEREEGMVAFLKDTNEVYRLIDGVNNQHWSDITPSPNADYTSKKELARLPTKQSIHDLILNFPNSKTIYVDELSGNDNTGKKGSILRPFKTLNYILFNEIIASGDTVILQGGNYSSNQNLVQNFKTYTLFCNPGVTIHYDGNASLFDSRSGLGNVFIYGKPNITGGVAGQYLFVILQNTKLDLGAITTDGRGIRVSEYNSGFTLITADSLTFKSSPGIRCDNPISTGGFIVFKIGQIFSQTSNSIYVEFDNSYAVSFINTLFFHGKTIFNNNVTYVKFASRPMDSVIFNNCSIRSGITANPTIGFDFGNAAISNSVYLRNCDFFFGSSQGTNVGTLFSSTNPVSIVCDNVAWGAANLKTSQVTIVEPQATFSNGNGNGSTTSVPIGLHKINRFMGVFQPLDF